MTSADVENGAAAAVDLALRREQRGQKRRNGEVQATSRRRVVEEERDAQSWLVNVVEEKVMSGERREC